MFRTSEAVLPAPALGLFKPAVSGFRSVASAPDIDGRSSQPSSLSSHQDFPALPKAKQQKEALELPGPKTDQKSINTYDLFFDRF